MTKIKNYTTKLSLIVLLLAQSCSFVNSKNSKLKYDCNEIFFEVNQRHQLFNDLTSLEIKKRQKQSLPTTSKIYEDSVFSKIIQAVKVAPENAKLIPVDLRYYKKVDLGNIIVSNIKPSLLSTFLKTSKYSQGYFALINFNKQQVKYFPVQVNKTFPVSQIDRNDLEGAELVFNVSNSQEISGNMKFSPNQQVSIIADNISKPYRLDLRESSNMQFNLDKKWLMNFYSFENSKLIGGKITTGYFKFVNNKNSQIKIHKFNRSTAKCYVELNDSKFN